MPETEVIRSDGIFRGNVQCPGPSEQNRDLWSHARPNRSRGGRPSQRRKSLSASGFVRSASRRATGKLWGAFTTVLEELTQT